jgi:hypothetical protein
VISFHQAIILKEANSITSTICVLRVANDNLEILSFIFSTAFLLASPVCREAVRRGHHCMVLVLRDKTVLAMAITDGRSTCEQMKMNVLCRRYSVVAITTDSDLISDFR